MSAAASLLSRWLPKVQVMHLPWQSAEIETLQKEFAVQSWKRMHKLKCIVLPTGIWGCRIRWDLA